MLEDRLQHLGHLRLELAIGGCLGGQQQQRAGIHQLRRFIRRQADQMLFPAVGDVQAGCRTVSVAQATELFTVSRKREYFFGFVTPIALLLEGQG